LIFKRAIKPVKTVFEAATFPVWECQMKSIFLASALVFTVVITYASPTLCKYAIPDKAYPNAKHVQDNIGQVYLDADLVVSGYAREKVINQPQKINVRTVIKGRADARITLIGLHADGTDPWGAAIPADGDYLLFLKNGLQFAWVEPGYCSNAFRVRDGKVEMGRQRIDVDDLEKYLSSMPTVVQSQSARLKLDARLTA
jgi:hypothetical protein